MRLSFRPLPLIGVAALALAPQALFAQAFQQAGSVDYRRADHSPRGACEDLQKFEVRDLVSLRPEPVAASGTAPAFCRVSGVLSPEVAFEVSLPGQVERPLLHDRQRRTRGRGAGRPRPRRATRRRAEERLRHGQTNTGHDARKEPGGTFVLNDPQQGDRLRLARRAPHGDHRQGDREAVLRPQPSTRRTGTPARTAGARARSRRSVSPRISTASSSTRRGSTRPASRSARCGISVRSSAPASPAEKIAVARESRRWRSATRSTA